MKALQAVQSFAEAGHNGDQGREHLDFSGPWFNARTAAAYVPCKSVKAFYMWRTRHGVIPRANGSVAKADLDRALALRRKSRRVMHPRSLANLEHGRKRASTVVPVSMLKSGN